MDRNLPCYDISIDPSLSDDGQPLKLDMIAYTSNPAIITKGFAFEETKKMRFEDSLKLRLFAPILIPDLKIYRKDDELGEYNVKFSKDVIEKLMTQFMVDRPDQQFNLDHQTQLNPKSDIIEIWKVRNSKTDYSFTEFGIEIPEGSYVCISQFHDKEYFQKEIIEKGRTGLSVEGILGLALSQIKKQNKMEKINEKQKFEAYDLADAQGKVYIDGEVAVDSYVYNEAPSYMLLNNVKTEVKYPYWGANIELATGEILTLVDSKIVEITQKQTNTDTEMSEKTKPATDEEVAKEKPITPVEEKKEEKKEEKLADEPIDEATPTEAPAETKPALDEAAILALIQPKLDEIFKALAELKTKVESDDITDAEMAEKTKPNKLSSVESLASFFKMSQES